MSDLLVVAGEASGDALAAPVVERLGARAFGLGGPALRAAGCEVLADLASFSAMGLAALRRARQLALAGALVVRAVRRRRPSAALLVGFSEFNGRLAPWLRARGVRVVWYAPPQVWAWRRGRAPGIAAACARLAVVLPFERAPWRRAGADVDYVGHPALGRAFAPAGEPGGEAPALRVALLPGSRAHEVHAHARPLFEAARRLRNASPGWTARLVRAPSLEPETRAWLARAARDADVEVVDAPLETAVGRHHVALVASGTATLECAALGVPPVVLYRTDLPTYLIARALVRVSHIGLPNLVLGERAFPELVQRDATGARLADTACAVLADRRRAVARCAAVRRELEKGLDDRTPADRVAAMVSPWLA